MGRGRGRSGGREGHTTTEAEAAAHEPPPKPPPADEVEAQQPGLTRPQEGAGSREHGWARAEQGGRREQGAGSREQGAGSREQGAGAGASAGAGAVRARGRGRERGRARGRGAWTRVDGWTGAPAHGRIPCPVRAGAGAGAGAGQARSNSNRDAHAQARAHAHAYRGQEQGHDRWTGTRVAGGRASQRRSEPPRRAGWSVRRPGSWSGERSGGSAGERARRAGERDRGLQGGRDFANPPACESLWSGPARPFVHLAALGRRSCAVARAGPICLFHGAVFGCAMAPGPRQRGAPGRSHVLWATRRALALSATAMGIGGRRACHGRSR